MGTSQAVPERILQLPANGSISSPKVCKKLRQVKPGRCPGPRGLTLLFRKGQLHRKEKRQRPRHCPLQTRYGAHVAPQRCTIPRTGKAIPLYHICKMNASTKNQSCPWWWVHFWRSGTESDSRSQHQSTKLVFSFTYCAQVCDDHHKSRERTSDCKENWRPLVLFLLQVIIYHTFPSKSIDVTHTLYLTSVFTSIFQNLLNFKAFGS